MFSFNIDSSCVWIPCRKPESKAFNNVDSLTIVLEIDGCLDRETKCHQCDVSDIYDSK